MPWLAQTALEALPHAGWWVSVSILVAILGEVLAAVFVVRVLTRGGSSSATLAWVMVILAAPWIGLLLYYLLPRRLNLRKLARRADSMAWIDPALQNVAAPASSGPEGGSALTRLLCGMDSDAVYDGNRLALLATGADFVARTERALATAQRFVHLETYIFRPDSAGLQLLELMAATARRGVEVRLLYDSIGSWSLKRRHLTPLLAAGGHAHAYAPLLWRHRPFTLNLRNHRKLLVVDGEMAILGGRNIGDEYASDHFGETGRWLDTMLSVEGPAVTRLHRVFVEDWFHASDQDLAQPRYFPAVEPCGDDRIGIVASGPDARHDRFSWALFHLISTAERSVDISSPYVIPDASTLTALQVAAASGVRVRILTNGRAVAQGILHRAQRSYYRALLQAGLEIRESGTDYNHAKLLVVDDRRLLIGSPNLDVRSERLNLELAVVTEDTPVCARAASLFARRYAQATPVRQDDPRRRPWDPLLDGVCRLLSPLL